MIPAFILSLIMHLQEAVSNLFLTKKLKDHPNDCNALLKSAELPLKKGEYQEALIRYGRVLQLDPNNKVANFYTAIVNLKLKNFPQSVTAFENYLSDPISKPKNDTEREIYYLLAEAYYYMGYAYHQLEKLEKARECKKVALTKDKSVAKLKLY